MANTTTKKKRGVGRPRKPFGQRKNRNMTFRVRSELLKHIEQAARNSERSMSAEIERRLEQSFVNARTDEYLNAILTELRRGNDCIRLGNQELRTAFKAASAA